MEKSDYPPSISPPPSLSLGAIVKKSLLIQLISYSSAIIISLMVNGIKDAEIALFVSFFTFPAILIINLIYCWIKSFKTYKGRNAMMVWLIVLLGLLIPIIILSLATVGCLSLTNL